MTIKPVYLVVIIIVSAAFGRYLTPAKIKIEKEIQIKEVVKTDENSDKKSSVDRTKNREIVVTKISRPDGTVEETTTTKENTVTAKNTDEKDHKLTDKSTETKEKESKTVESLGGTTRIAVLAGVDVFNVSGGYHWGGHIDHDILGPITVGVFGFSSGVAGVSLGLRF